MSIKEEKGIDMEGIKMDRLYLDFCNENVSQIGLWNWEQERMAFGFYCYLSGLKETKQKMIKEFKEMIDKIRNKYSKLSENPEDYDSIVKGNYMEELLEELKSQVSNHSSPLIKEDEKPKTGEKSPVHAKKQLEK